MKNILLVLLLTCTCLWAQIPPPGGAPVAADTNAVVTISPSQTYNLSEAELNKVYGPDEINFKAATIDEFLTVYANVVNRTILRPATLPAPTITLRNQTPLTKREAIQLFDAVLGINGIVIINVGEKFAKALPVADAAGGGGKISHVEAAALPEMGQYVTHVVQLKYTKPEDMIKVIQPFAKIPNSILPIEGNNVLVIRDYAENVKRMLEMIEEVDISVPAEYISEVIPIKYAIASDISSALNSLGGGGGSVTVGNSSTSARSSARGTSRSGLGGLGQTGTQGALGTQGGVGGVGGVGGIGTQGSTGGTFTDRLRSIINKASTPGTPGSGDINILGTTKIIADERTNSLLVYATREDMKTIKDVISKLDVVLAQVLIESIIMSVSANDSLTFGISASQNPRQLNSSFYGGGVVNNDKDLLGQGVQWFNGTGTNGLSSIPNTGGLSYFGKFNDKWNVALQALASDGKTEVLQKPVIMTTHATAGHFFVGDTVPYVTSTYYGGGYGGGPSSSYQQLRVGIDVNVTPFINPDGIVVMKIDQQIEQLSGSVDITGVGKVPTTSSRTLSADVTVSNRDTIILGGFITSSGSKNKSGVPLLKDIPLVGALFRSTSNSKDRSELVVLMRPTVLDTPHMAALGSRDVQDNMPGVSRFEKRLKKEDADFQNKMDRLDGVKSAPTPPTSSYVPPTEDPHTEALRHAVEAHQEQPGTASQELSDWTKGSGTAPAAATAAPATTTVPATPAAKPAPAKTQDPFKTAQPMTEEELKAFGRLPEN